MASMDHIAVLGGGVAGLALGFYARKQGLPFTLFEASDQVGGNCRTLQHGAFRFDTGAHRFHDQETAATEDLLALLGDKMREVHAPSQIFHNGRFIDFPLSPLNVAHRLGLRSSMRAAMEVVSRRLRRMPEAECFESFARGQYGDTIAEKLLLNYSEKLWGAPCSELSPGIAGQRLKGLTFGTFVREALVGRKGKTRHLDGAFYYPAEGIGMIPDHLARACGLENIRTHARVTRIFTADDRVEAIEINGSERLPVQTVVSSLPLDELVRDLMPPAPPGIQAHARSLQYRAVLLVVLFLERDQVTPNASIYFPDADVPFTRLYEPKNRSARMAPSGRTALMAEIPCQPQEAVWQRADDDLTRTVCRACEEIHLIHSGEVLEAVVVRLPYAYPVLRKTCTVAVDAVQAHLSRFDNLTLIGRNGRFQYTHIHDMMGLAKAYVAACS